MIEYCPECGKELIKSTGWNFLACINPYCLNYPARNFIGNTEMAILSDLRLKLKFLRKKKEIKKGVEIYD